MSSFGRNVINEEIFRDLARAFQLHSSLVLTFNTQMIQGWTKRFKNGQNWIAVS